MKRTQLAAGRRLATRIIAGPLLLAWATVLLGAATAAAHIVPSEKLHPVAEAYRRATFILNLNPVVWEQVGPDVGTIAEHWRALDSAAAGEFVTELNGIIAEATRRGDEANGSAPLPRAVAARQVFERMTRGVATIGRELLRRAEQELGDRYEVESLLRAAQGVYGSFDDVLPAVDPQAYQRLGRCWLAMSSALGSEGLLGRGAAEVDRERFVREAREIVEYMDAHFGPQFASIEGRRLAPWPIHSPTFDRNAVLPARLPPGANTNKQLPRPRQILNMTARGVNESETALIALGDMAFDSPYIFGEPARALAISCNTCHNKSITNPQFVVPGLSARAGGMDVSNSFFAPHANNGHFNPLDIPDLRGIRFLAPYGRNGRLESLREFVRNVIVNEFNGPEPDPTLLDGMVAYMFEFDFLPNPYLNPDGSLSGKASAAARRGEEIFRRPFEQMAGMSCASCHIPSANFVDHKRHDIGSVRGASEHSKDGALDTPTLLGIRYTPPYFHDGSQPTLRAVNEWFNDVYTLGLSEQELADLTSYVETVGDGVDAYENTVHTLEAELEEFSFFLSAFEFLEQQGKRDLIDATCQTIALEIRAHKWDLQDYAHMPVLDRLAELMDQAYAANQNGAQEEVRALVREYRETYRKHAEALK